MAENGDAAGGTAATDTVDALRRRIDVLEQSEANARRRLRMTGLGLAALAVVGALTYAVRNEPARRVADIEATAIAAIESMPALTGYPITIQADQQTLTAMGLAPSDAARAELARVLGEIAGPAGMTLRLMTPVPTTAIALQADDIWSVIRPKLGQALTPVTAAASEAAIRVQDFDDALIAARQGLAQQQMAMDALTGRVEATVENRSELLTRIETRLEALDDETRILGAEIKAGERFAERRRQRLLEDMAADIAAVRTETGEARAAVAAASAHQADAQGMLKARLTDATDALEISLAALAASQADAAQIAGALGQTVDDLSAAQQAHGGDLADLRATVATAAAEEGERLRALGMQANANAAALDAAAKASAEQQTSLRGVISRATTLESRIAKLEGAMGQAMADLRAIDAATINLSQSASTGLDDLAAETDAVSQRATAASLTAERAAETAQAAAATAARLEAAATEWTALSSEVARLGAALDRQAISAVASLELSPILIENSPAASSKLADTSSTIGASSPNSGPNAANAAMQARIEALEGRAGEAIALLDQRIDRLAKATEPRTPSELVAASQQIAGVRIQFASAAQPVDADDANATLRMIGEITRALPKSAQLRVVGYADSDGTTEANRITSKRRSDWAVDELAKIGVPRARMVSVGRGAERLLSPDATDDSPNRRVEFEIVMPTDDG